MESVVYLVVSVTIKSSSSKSKLNTAEPFDLFFQNLCMLCVPRTKRMGVSKKKQNYVQEFVA